jgi:hypothetical protein
VLPEIFHEPRPDKDNTMRTALNTLVVVLGVLTLVVGTVFLVFGVFHVGSIDLPLAETVTERNIEHPAQNWKYGWGLNQTQWFHHASQGTKILPYEWFMALERPEIFPPGAHPRFVENDYLYRFGFLPSERNDKFNADNLPIGFAREDHFIDPTNPKKGPFRVVGLTCAACHTGEIHYKNSGGELKGIRIEGGPAMINLALFEQAIGLALFYTQRFEARFNRFADRVLALEKKENVQDERDKLRTELNELVNKGLSDQSYAEKKGLYALNLGFARTDALGLIGNRVFGPLANENLTVANAPVNFPHLWDTPWFDWVQYNASIRMPMVRNIGEALGVGAVVKLDVPKDERFPSTVNVGNIHLMEDQLGGPKPFEGLRSPKWSDTGLPPIDAIKRGRGEALYRKYCQDCHLPPTNELEADLSKDQPRYWYNDGPKIRVLRLKVSDIQEIGTDPNQALNFYRRLAYTGGKTVSAAKGLYNVTAFIRKQFYESNHLSKDQISEYDRDRPFDDPKIDKGDFDLEDEGVISNVIVSRLGYKARPLDGIWATAPYLHNGSVPNLYQMLSPVKERDTKFYLGSKLFDPVRVGFVTDRLSGGFELDTTLSGNTNTGHEHRNFELDEMELATKGAVHPANDLHPEESHWAELVGLSVEDWKASSDQLRWERIRDQTWKLIRERGIRAIPKGVIGPALSEMERWDLVEYLKSL